MDEGVLTRPRGLDGRIGDVPLRIFCAPIFITSSTRGEAKIVRSLHKDPIIEA